jgi:hypothetical protein
MTIATDIVISIRKYKYFYTFNYPTYPRIPLLDDMSYNTKSNGTCLQR